MKINGGRKSVLTGNSPGAIRRPPSFQSRVMFSIA